MKTQIKTKDLLTLIDPATSGVIYEGSNIVVDFSEVKKFVEAPRTHKIFEKSNNTIDRLYKNIALYILNPSPESLIISIDLDSTNPIKNGLFEYLKAIYFNQENLYLSLPETGDNLLFIKSKNLIDIKDSHLTQPEYFKEAKDIQLGDLSSIFLQTKKLDPESISKINKVTEGSKFFWKENTEDIYSNVDYLLYEIQEILKQNKHEKDSPVLVQLLTLFSKVNNEILSSDEFKLKLLNLNDHYFTEKLFTSNEFSRIKDLHIDLNKEVFQEKILDDIKNKRFQLLNFAFKRHFNFNPKDYTEGQPKIDFHNLINQPETVEHLTTLYHRSSFADYGNRDFTIISAYPYFNKENKLSDQVIEKYMTCITNKTMSGNTYIAETPLFELPVELFQKDSFLTQLLPYVSIEKLNNFFKDNNIKSELLTNKTYIIKSASKLHPYNIEQILNNFFDKNDIDENFFHSLIYAKPQLFSHLFSDKDNSHKAHTYEHLIKNFDFIYRLTELGLKFSHIPKRIIKEYLLVDSQDNYKEQFKLDYLIDQQLLNKYGKALFDNPEDVKSFEKKFIKIENLFFSFSDYTYENKPRDTALGKVKTKAKLQEVLNKIENTSTDANFDSRSFYKAINPELQKDIEIIQRLLSYGKVSYTDLPEAIQFNKDIAIECIKQSHHTINKVPVEFFNDTDFSIKFAKLIDDQNITIEQAPVFIIKFFENQEVDKDYSKYLKSYILMNSINNKVEEQVPTSSTKKTVQKRKL